MSDDGPKPFGRPTVYKPEFCQTVIEVGEKGGWLCEMAEACDVHRTTMDVWAAKHPDFFEALMRAKQKAQKWFEEQGRKGLMADRFNANLWGMQMRARHREEYTERKELSGPNQGPIETKETGERVELLKAMVAAVAERDREAGDITSE